MQLRRKMEKRLIKTTSLRSLKEEAGSCSVFFTADTTYGAAGIRACMAGVANRGVKTSDALCALVLGVVEEKIQFVENWLRCVIDVVPGIEAPDQHARLFTLKDKGRDGSSISVHLPFRHWRLIPTFDTLSLPAHWEICWHSYQGSLTLSQLLLSKADVASIEHGSVVLLPESFRPAWAAVLEIPALRVGMSGVFDEQHSRWCADGQIVALSVPESLLDADDSSASDPEASATRPGSAENTSRVSCPLSLSARDLLNTSEAPPVLRLPPHSLGQVQLSVHEGQLMGGAIAPLANGYALYVNAVNGRVATNTIIKES